MPQMKKKPSYPGASTQGRWWHLKQRWSLIGVFEIDTEHQFYGLTSVMKSGLQTALHRCVVESVDTPRLDQLTAEQFRAMETQVHEGFEMQTFSGLVFASLRRSLGITEAEYQSSLTSDRFYLQFISNSKSKADFFVTHDKRFFLKTQSRREVNFLLANLQPYVEHLEKYPHSLMVRFLGVHRIVIPNQMKKYFIVMQSVFFPDERINIRYDIKGCDVGRWTDPAPEGSQVIKVLKDNNFEGQNISLGEQKLWFEEQVRIDSSFLQSLNVLDYSLLLAYQPLHQDELNRKNSLASLIIRTTKSLDLDESPPEAQPPNYPLLERVSSPGLPDPDVGSDARSDVGSGGLQDAGESADGIPLREMKCRAAGTSTEAELREFQAQHRRLLPNFKNSVHVIDGKECRYFVGIIDIFTVYSWKKKLEHFYKRLRFPGKAFSTVCPQDYAWRFCQWVQRHTQ